ncbi:ATP-NAD kinase-like domain-containing protein [Catenaria anguillulae PL171]|uniref:ATP-NAD kinase-like domain-containing protein n=1 Tax=Catenaria anguillulae PL171 TaxID=765915 RepID=A0A1Y2HUH7_9FUNG|nr:ATP-NAD kinase-like domain-containing protein [Catenaria anguillulae PL171]
MDLVGDSRRSRWHALPTQHLPQPPLAHGRRVGIRRRAGRRCQPLHCYSCASPTGAAKGAKRPTVDKDAPKLQSWTFVAESQEKAGEARRVLRDWLGVAGHDAKRLFVVVNPNSGARHGQRLLEKIVRPMLTIAGIKCDVAISQRPHHATELARDLPLADYSGALLVGGDGIVHEFWNGLLAHSTEPLARASRFPIAHVGAGTGNGLAASLNMTPAEISIHCAVKGWTRPFDMIEYRITPRADVAEQYGNKVEHGWTHLSITHGWLADLDIESEVLRALGSLRTDVWALYRMFAQIPYGVRIGYVRPEDLPTALAAAASGDGAGLIHMPRSKIVSGTAPGWTMHPPDQFIMVNVHNLPHLSTDFNGCPLAQPDNGSCTW